MKRLDQMNIIKFRQMSLKKKIQWLIHYYGVILLACLAGIFVVGYFVKTVFFAPPAADVHVLMLSDQVSEEMTVEYEQEISQMTGKSVEIENYSESDTYGTQAFAAKVGTDVLDLVIAPEKESTMLAENGFLLSYAQISDTHEYMGVARGAREGEALQTAMEYLENKLSEL